jgi:hypothetical protein
MMKDTKLEKKRRDRGREAPYIHRVSPDVSEVKENFLNLHII